MPSSYQAMAGKHVSVCWHSETGQDIPGWHPCDYYYSMGNGAVSQERTSDRGTERFVSSTIARVCLVTPTSLFSGKGLGKK